MEVWLRIRMTRSLNALLVSIISSMAAHLSSQHSSHSIGHVSLLSSEQESSRIKLLPERLASLYVGCWRRALTDGLLISAFTACSADFKSANSLRSDGSSFPSMFNFPACSLMRRKVSAKGPVRPSFHGTH